MNNSRTIGKITSIGIQGIIGEVYEDLGNYINTIDGVRFVGEVGSYVTIYEIGRIIVAEVIGVDEKTQLSNNNDMKKPNSRRQIYLNLLGEIIENYFYFGVSKMPLIFSEIHVISEKDLTTMLEVGDEEKIISEEDNNTRAILLPIGQSVIFPDYNVKVNIDKFFGFHFAVFGNTGTGKSNTIARVLQNIFIKNGYSAKGAKFVIIDSNGEYNKAFSKISEVNSDVKQSLFIADESNTENKLEIPVWALSADDWAVLLHASEKTQIPVLKRAIDIAKLFYGEKNTNNDVKNHILASTLLGIILSSDTSPSKSDKLKAIISNFSTTEVGMDVNCEGMTLRQAVTNHYGEMPNEEKVITFLNKFINQDLIANLITATIVPYDLAQFVEAVDFATLYEGSVSSQRIQEYTATLTTRLQTIKDGVQGKILSKTEFSSVDSYIENLLGSNQIVDIDISSLDDTSAEVVTKVLAKLILDYLKQRQNKADMPINFIIEEAHRFVRNESNYGAVGYNIFERIAKEGRKFGFLLGISSQRPSELSKTVVSQCSNFIIHRVQNPDDLQYISKMVPYVNQNIIERLTYLQTGNALVFGNAINLPTLTRFEQAVPKTDSDNAKISERWYTNNKYKSI